jgi:hypothetical protein
MVAGRTGVLCSGGPADLASTVGAHGVTTKPGLTSRARVGHEWPRAGYAGHEPGASGSARGPPVMPARAWLVVTSASTNWSQFRLKDSFAARVSQPRVLAVVLPYIRRQACTCLGHPA